MSDKKPSIEIDPQELVDKLNVLQTKFENDLACIVEFLLLENHVLNMDQSQGFRRGVDLEFSEFPRFLEMTKDA